jgi:hypothetical protein
MNARQETGPFFFIIKYTAFLRTFNGKKAKKIIGTVRTVVAEQ